MSSYSANDIIKKALTKARVIHPSDSIPAGKAKDAFENLNDLIEGWALEKLMVLADVMEAYTLTSGTAEYTWGGSTANITTARPVEVKDDIQVRTGNTDYPMRLSDLGFYRRLREKTTTGRPRIIAAHMTYPTITLYLYPTPDSGSYSLRLRSQKMAVDVFTDRTTEADLEPGYGKALIENLAVIMCMDYGKRVPAALAASAAHIKRQIKSANSIPVPPLRASQLTGMMRQVRTNTIEEGPF